MDVKKSFSELGLILIVAIVLGIAFAFPSKGYLAFLTTAASFLIIILINTFAKIFFAHNLETNVNTKIWSWYRTGFKKGAHFAKPLPMIWLPILTSLLTKGLFVWLPVLEFDVSPKPERITRRHGLYRYTEVTEWHIALIAVFGIIANIVVGVVGYFAGFESFAKLSILYAAWSLLPISSLDGTKIFFGSRNLWYTITIITLAIFFWSLAII